MAEAPAYVQIWPRSYAKSTNEELATIYLASRGTVDSQVHRDLEADWRLWLYCLFPSYLGGDTPIAMASYHEEFWRWIAALDTPRRYAIYVSDTQDQAEQHVQSIADMLTSPIYARWYPQMAARRLTKYGHSAGWRRTRLRTASGFTVDAAGLDKGIRGAKIDEQRPDLILLDDLDRENDSPTVTQRKVRNLTRTVIPTQGPGCVFIGAQNLIIRGGIFSQLADGTADFLLNRHVSGPHPALRNFDPDRDLEGLPDGTWRITGGEPTWRDLAYAQKLLNDYGREAFLVECQHTLSAQSGLVYGQFDPSIHEYQYAALPEFVAYYGGWDFGGEGDTAHNSALTVAGLTENGRLVLLDEWYDNGANVFDRQTTKALEWEATYGRIKWNQDGDERTTFQTLRKAQFDITMSRRHSGSKPQRIRRMGRRLTRDGSGRPGWFYLRKCRRWRYEVERWRRPPQIPGVPASDDPIGVDDDVLVSSLYLVERCELEQDAAGVEQRQAVAI